MDDKPIHIKSRCAKHPERYAFVDRLDVWLCYECGVEFMNIRQVESLYAKKGKNEIRTDYRAIVDTFRKLKRQEPIPNDDYLHGLYLTDLMLASTRKHIRMLTGTGESNWLAVLEPTLVKTLARITEAKGFFKAIFVGEGKLPAAIHMLSKQFGETIQVQKAQAEAPIRHFIACDSYMLRLESVHPPITPDMDSSMIKGDVYFSNVAKTKSKEEEFDFIWSYLECQD